MKIVCQPPPRETRHGHSLPISVLALEQNVQASLHREVERSQAARAAQIKLVHAVMRVIRPAKLSHAHPLRVQHQHSALRQIDAANLFVGDRFPRAVVAVDVHGHRNFSNKRNGLIQQRGNPHSRDGFIPQLADAILGPPLDGLKPHDFRLLPAPLGRFAAENNFVERVLAPTLGTLSPIRSRTHRRHQRNARLGERLNLAERNIGIDDRTRQQFFNFWRRERYVRETDQRNRERAKHPEAVAS